MRLLVHSTFGDNNLALFHLHWTETMLKHKNVLDILWETVGGFPLHSKFQMKLKVNKQLKHKIVTVRVDVTVVKAKLQKKISSFVILADLELRKRNMEEILITKIF